jgi:hypothetical protein
MISGPTDEQRTVILGRTGSGKSVFACNLLYHMTNNYWFIPWVVIDYKGDKLIQAIAKACKWKKISCYDSPPTRPGIYYMRPTPVIDDIAMESWLWKVWHRARYAKPLGSLGTGLYIDEGYVLPSKAAFDVILTQGRSLGIPVIILYQRPVWMSRFAVAQADFFAIFDQNDERDLKTTQSFIKPITDGGRRIDVYTKLPKHYCLWYDVNEGETTVLSPCPSPKDVLALFKSKYKPESVQDERIFLYA